MNCDNCGTSLDQYKDFKGNMHYCPFCGYKFIPKENRKFETLQETLKYVIGSFGLEIILNEKKLISIINDLIPRLEKERKIFKIALKEGVGKIFYEAYINNDMQEFVIKKIENRLIESVEMSATGINFICECLFYSVDMNQKNETEIEVNNVPLEPKPFRRTDALKLLKVSSDIVIPYGYTEIEARAFYCSQNIRSVVIPSSINMIHHSAFQDCTSLKKVDISLTVKNVEYNAFDNTYWLKNNEADFIIVGDNILIKYKGKEKNVVIPEIVTSIADGAFEGCTFVDKITISERVNKVGYKAFDDTKWLRNYEGDFIIGGKNILIRYKGKKNNVVIPNEITDIADGAFEGCKTMTSLIIPSGVKAINEYAFCDCSALTNIELPKTIEKIGKGAFDGCRSLLSVSLPNLSIIEESMFESCSSLLSVSIPNTVSEIEPYAFFECVNLKTIRVSEYVTKIGNEAFGGCNNLIFKCREGTAIQEYASKHKLKYENR